MNFRSENKIKIAGGMSTMTDLVFLLLIFFIVISTLITAGVNVDVPRSGGDPSDKKILKINITETNEYEVSLLAKGKEKSTKGSPVSSDELELHIQKNIGLDSTISLFGNSESSWEANVFVIDLAKQNNYKIVMNGEQ